jgi:hypothetical protein
MSNINSAFSSWSQTLSSTVYMIGKKVLEFLPGYG